MTSISAQQREDYVKLKLTLNDWLVPLQLARMKESVLPVIPGGTALTLKEPFQFFNYLEGQLLLSPIHLDELIRLLKIAPALNLISDYVTPYQTKWNLSSDPPKNVSVSPPIRDAVNDPFFNLVAGRKSHFLERGATAASDFKIFVELIHQMLEGCAEQADPLIKNFLAVQDGKFISDDKLLKAQVIQFRLPGTLKCIELVEFQALLVLIFAHVLPHLPQLSDVYVALKSYLDPQRVFEWQNNLPALLDQVCSDYALRLNRLTLTVEGQNCLCPSQLVPNLWSCFNSSLETMSKPWRDLFSSARIAESRLQEEYHGSLLVRDNFNRFRTLIFSPSLSPPLTADQFVLTTEKSGVGPLFYPISSSRLRRDLNTLLQELLQRQSLNISSSLLIEPTPPPTEAAESSDPETFRLLIQSHSPFQSWSEITKQKIRKILIDSELTTLDQFGPSYRAREFTHFPDVPERIFNSVCQFLDQQYQKKQQCSTFQ